MFDESNVLIVSVAIIILSVAGFLVATFDKKEFNFMKYLLGYLFLVEGTLLLFKESLYTKLLGIVILLTIVVIYGATKRKVKKVK